MFGRALGEPAYRDFFRWPRWRPAPAAGCDVLEPLFGRGEAALAGAIGALVVAARTRPDPGEVNLLAVALRGGASAGNLGDEELVWDL